MRLFSNIISGMFHPLLMVTDVWSCAGSHLHISGNLSASNETIARRRSVPVYGGYPRSIYLYDGKKRGGGRYGAIGQT